MATKPPGGGFKSDKEKQKWERIQSQGTTTINKMLSGAATPDDIRSLSDLVSKQAEMAGKIFDEGIASAEATADAIIDKLNQDRIATGKNPLTLKAQEKLFRQTFQKILSESTEDIIGAVKDYLDETLDKRDADYKDLVNNAFEKIRKITEPSTTAEVTREEKAEPGATAEAVRKGTSHIQPAFDTLESRILDFIEKGKSPFMQKIDALEASLSKSYNTALAKSPLLQKVDALTGKVGKTFDKAVAIAKDSQVFTKFKTLFTEDNPPENIAGRSSILGGFRRLFKGQEKDERTAGDEEQPVKKGLGERVASLFGKKTTLEESPQFKTLEDLLKARKVKTDEEVEADVRAQADTHTEIAGKMPIDQQIAVALKANEELREQALLEWKKIKETGGDDEDKKSETWLRKVKNMFGEGKKKAKDALGSKGFLTGLIAALVTAITNPQLIDTISGWISKYLNFETISKFVSDTWDDVKSGGTKVLDWIIDKVTALFHPKKDEAQAKKDTALRAAASDTSKVNIPQNTTADDAQKKIPELEKLVQGTTSDLAKAQSAAADARKSGKPVPADVQQVLNDAPLQIGVYKRLMNQYKAVAATSTTVAGSTPAAAATLTGPSPAPSPGVNQGAAVNGAPGAGTVGGTKTLSTGADSKLSGPSPTTIAKSSSAAIAPTPDATKISQTSVVAETKPAYKEGIAVDDTSKITTPGGAPKSDSANVGNAVSMGSFGFLSGDDSLNAMNMGMMA